MSPFDDAMAKMMGRAMDKVEAERKAREGFPKLCSVCFSAFSLRAWKGLAVCGLQDDPEQGDLELRGCPCGNTLSIRVCINCKAAPVSGDMTRFCSFDCNQIYNSDGSVTPEGE